MNADVTILGVELQFLPEKAVYIKHLQSLFVADIHLGKSETFQTLGVPIPNTVNQATLDRLQHLCSQFNPKKLFILGDLFHSKFALVDEVLDSWSHFQNAVNAEITLIIGNHDRKLVQSLPLSSIQYSTDAIQIDNLLLSHEPAPQKGCLNICGHVHPCVHLREKLDSLRLPCFYLDHSKNLLILPSFGEFTGAYELPLTRNTTAYIVVENCVVPLSRQPKP